MDQRNCTLESSNTSTVRLAGPHPAGVWASILRIAVSDEGNVVVGVVLFEMLWSHLLECFLWPAVPRAFIFAVPKDCPTRP